MLLGIVPATEVANLEAYLKGSGKFNNILALMKRTGPTGTLTGLQNIGLFASAGPITLFLPTDAAYAKLDGATKSRLTTGDFAALQAVLQFQVVISRQTSTQLAGYKRGSTFQTKYKGQTFEKFADGTTFVLRPIGLSTTTSTVVMKDAYMPASMAMHGVDTFLFPKV